MNRYGEEKLGETTTVRATARNAGRSHLQAGHFATKPALGLVPFSEVTQLKRHKRPRARPGNAKDGQYKM